MSAFLFEADNGNSIEISTHDAQSHGEDGDDKGKNSLEVSVHNVCGKGGAEHKAEESDGFTNAFHFCFSFFS